MSVIAAAVYPFDHVLSGMVAAGLGIEGICLYLGLSRAALDDSLVRLGLRTPHDRPLRKGGAARWSTREIMQLIAWRVSGVHPATIAERLGRSVGAVRAKARRLGIPVPSRRSLHRPDPSTLVDPVEGFGFPDPVRDAAHAAAMAEKAAQKPVAVRTQSSTKLRRPETHFDFVMDLSMRYFGGQNRKHMCQDLGLTPGTMRSILNRINLPRDHTRSKFGATHDPECARATLERSGFELARCNGAADRPVNDRPLFWRRIKDRATVTKRRVIRLREGRISEYEKYKSELITLVTRAELDAVQGSLAFEKTAIAVAVSPLRSQTLASRSLHFTWGFSDEKRQRDRDPSPVRPGLPGRSGQQVPWAYAGNGRSVEHIARP